MNTEPTQAVRSLAQALVGAGYRAYDCQMRAADKPHYQISYQKVIEDAQGKRYFVNVDLFDFTGLKPELGGRASANVQFHRREDRSKRCDVSIDFDGDVVATEAFFATMWEAMGFAYYDRS